ncbi:MAG TPA: type II toxin-antitoxin system PemK/MazF family toxin [Candidatus Dormibacteraeota bacterium]|nr:type II toxin-antitoxin system PemK/MazF family toxin [Candidatus Dormibacteraeota bacterium]
MRPTGRPSIPRSTTTSRAPRRGEVWLARLDKVRPIVVLSRDPMGQLLQAVISAPVTSTIRGLSTEVRLGPADGVRIESVANLDNVQLVARARLVRRVGRARPAIMNAICTALSTAVGCG